MPRQRRGCNHQPDARASGRQQDVAKLNWLAKTSMAPKGGRWCERRYATIKDAERADPLTWSATGPADNISDVAAIISYVLGLQSRLFIGYRGAGDDVARRHAQRGRLGILSADTAFACPQASR
jgi:hypothetical protein